MLWNDKIINFNIMMGINIRRCQIYDILTYFYLLSHLWANYLRTTKWDLVDFDQEINMLVYFLTIYQITTHKLILNVIWDHK